MAIAVDPVQVRALLDVTLATDTLSDATINLDAYAGRANEIVHGWLAALDLTTLPDADPVVVRAANLETAALIAPALPMITREAIPDYSTERTKIDRDAQANDLETQAYAQLADAAFLLYGTYNWSPVFAKAEGRRGQFFGFGRRAEGARPYPLSWPLL